MFDRRQPKRGLDARMAGVGVLLAAAFLTLAGAAAGHFP
jgi:hypothetical protein